LKRASLPIVAPAELGISRFQELMSVDKKVIDGTLRLVLLKGIGKAVVSDGFSMAALVETLTECRAA
jgi:3-dehydroquinate synthase